jgi:hypothetical protein
MVTTKPLSQVPGQDIKTVVLTQAQYDALPVKDPKTLYVIVG